MEEMQRILSREAHPAERYTSMDKLKVGIIGISPGAGVGLISGCLARYLANTGKHQPAVIEIGGGSLYDSFGMDKRFAGRTWVQFYLALSERKNIRGLKNMDEGINWILKSPKEWGITLDFGQKMRLVSHACGDIILCDLSGEAEPDYQMLQCMDQIIAVIDPLPSKMLRGHMLISRLKSLEIDNGNIIYVINKMNSGVNCRQMFDYLKIKKTILMPLVNPELIYKSEYNCNIPYTQREVRNAMQGPLGEIASALII